MASGAILADAMKRFNDTGRYRSGLDRSNPFPNGSFELPCIGFRLFQYCLKSFRLLGNEFHPQHFCEVFLEEQRFMSRIEVGVIGQCLPS